MLTLVSAEALWMRVQLEGCVARESRGQENISDVLSQYIYKTTLMGLKISQCHCTHS